MTVSSARKSFESRGSRKTVQNDVQLSASVQVWQDPVAQSFLVDQTGGVFITKIAVYFQAKASVSSEPVTLQIREMELGLPTQKILPYADVAKKPAEITISSDASTATEFVFESPVYLKQNQEYCFVLLSNSNEYYVWQATLGEIDINNGHKITKQPYAGVMFSSQNASTWTPHQETDLKFQIFKATFDTTKSSKARLKNMNTQEIKLRNDPFKTTQNTKTVTVQAPNHGFARGDKVKFKTTNGNVTIGGIIVSSSDSNAVSRVVDTDSYEFQLKRNATLTGLSGGDSVISTSNIKYDLFMPNIQSSVLPNTLIDWKMKTAGAEAGSPLGAFAPIVMDENNYLSTPSVVTNVDTKNDTLQVEATFSSNNANISPVIDLDRSAVNLISNRVNASTVSQSQVDKYLESLHAKYVTKTINITNLSSSLRILVNVNKPTGSDVECWIKTAPDGDGIGGVTYVKVAPTVPIIANDDGNHYEVQYDYNPSDDFTAYKVLFAFTTPNTSKSPSISGLRTIAVV